MRLKVHVRHVHDSLAMTHDPEAQLLQLLSEMLRQLADALNSLAGKQRNGLWDGFLGFSAVHINRAGHGYLHLRQSSLVDASKLLIRPALETMLRILAVRAKPSLLYRIAFTEWSEDRKLARAAAKRSGQECDTEFQQAWTDFRAAYARQLPDHELQEAALSAFEASEVAGIGGIYDSAYRLYCQFTHGALRATTGDLSSTDMCDTRTMAFCVLSALEAVMSIGGEAPRLVPLRDRLDSLCQP